MKRSLMLFALILLLVVLISSSAFATLARIRSLGNADYFFKDIYQIYRNPAWLGMYTNSVYGELGTYGYYYDGVEQYDETSQGQFLGINYKVYKGLSLGLTLSREVDWMPSEFEIFDHWEGEFPAPINGYDILASYDFEKLHLGVSFYHAGNKEDKTDAYTREDTTTGDEYYFDRLTENEFSSAITSLTGGVLFDFDENKCIEGMLRLSFDRSKYDYYYSDTLRSDTYYEREIKNKIYETDGGTRIEFGARAFWEIIESFQLVPLFAFGTESISLDSMVIDFYRDSDPFPDERADTASGKSGDLKKNYLFFGLGGNLKLDKGMVAGGLNLTRVKTTDERGARGTVEHTETFMPGFNLGVEYELTKWLVARIGMEKWFGSSEVKSDSAYSDPPWLYESHYNLKDRFSNYPEDFIGLGVGFKFSKFKVDATVGENSLFEGTYLLSGRERNLFGTLSAIFEF